VGWDAEFHERAIWDGIRLASDDREVIVPSREDAVLINAAHALYENKEIRLYDLEKIRSQWSLELDWEYMEGVARRRGWLDGLWFALLVCQKLERVLYGYRTVSADVVERWEWGLQQYPVQYEYWLRVKKRPLSLPLRLSFAFSKLLYYKKLLRDEHDTPRERVRNVIRTLAWGIKQKSGIRPQPGRLIAISGMDGTGKTAQARALSEAMTTSEVINRVVWTRAGCSPLYRTLRRIVGAQQAVHPMTEHHSSPTGVPIANPSVAAPLPRAPWIRTAWALANALDLALVYQWKVRLPLLTGKVVIADRYTADAAVEIARRTGADDPSMVAAARLLSALAPRPDASYLLDAPAEIAAFRSADPEDVSDLHRQRVLYRRAADAGKLHVLDATGDFSDVSERLVRHALREYEDNFATFTNGLFLSNPEQLNANEPLSLSRAPAAERVEEDAA
jgi:thymidylate kinase